MTTAIFLIWKKLLTHCWIFLIDYLCGAVLWTNAKKYQLFQISLYPSLFSCSCSRLSLHLLLRSSGDLSSDAVGRSAVLRRRCSRYCFMHWLRFVVRDGPMLGLPSGVAVGTASGVGSSEKRMSLFQSLWATFISSLIKKHLESWNWKSNTWLLISSVNTCSYPKFP